MSTEKPKDPTRVQLGSVKHPVRFSYLHAHTPKKKRDDNGNVVMDEETGKAVVMFSCQVRVSKADTATKAMIDAAVEAAAADFFGKKRPPANMMKTPLRDGDAEAASKEDSTLAGCWFFNCSSKQKPDVVGPRKNPETGKFDRLDESEIKSGDYGKISINFFGFDGKSKGVAAGMGNIQKLQTGDPLGSKTSAENDFDEEDVDDEAASAAGANALL